MPRPPGPRAGRPRTGRVGVLGKGGRSGRWSRMGQVAALAALAALLPTAAIAGRVAAASPAPAQRPATFTDHVVLNGARLTHPTPKGPKALSQPDDITDLGGHLFVGFQNGVGPQGQPSPTGNLDTTPVQVAGTGKAVHRGDWA